MKQVCAWCRTEIGNIESSVHSDSDVSHGICNNCLDNLTFQQGVPITDYLETLPLPVLLVDDYGIVKAVNKKACEVLGKEPLEIVQHLGGNVFECAYARLPEGCGRTVHCSACAIRRAVTTTYETGEPQGMVPAVLNREKGGRPSKIALSITTVKKGNVVVLRVDRIESSEKE